MQSRVVSVKHKPLKLNQRVPFMVEVSVVSQSKAGTRQYLAMNLGKGGLFLKTLLPLESGTMLRCAFRLPDGGSPIIANAKVAWTRRGAEAREHSAGMGIRFINLAKDEQHRLRAFVTDYEE
jgi:uncharacterized protein (TIGR02266 family)